MASHSQHVARKRVDDGNAVLQSAVFQNELNHVVLQKECKTQLPKRSTRTHAELILHQVGRVAVQFIQQRTRLVQRQVLEAALQDAAAIRMGSHLVHIAREGPHKAQSLRCDALDELLNDLDGE